MKDNTKAISTLIKIQENKLNTLKRQINLLLERLEQKQDLLHELLTQSEKELKHFSQNINSGFMLTSYIQNVLKSEKILLDEINLLEQQINNFRNELSLVFSEIKKLDIVKQNRINIIKENIKKLEDKNLDEVANNIHIRNN